MARTRTPQHAFSSQVLIWAATGLVNLIRQFKVAPGATAAKVLLVSIAAFGLAYGALKLVLMLAPILFMVVLVLLGTKMLFAKFAVAFRKGMR